MPDPARPAPLVIDYVTPLAADERIPQAEARIIAGAPTEQVRDLFASTKEAATFYARFQAERYAPAAVDGTCKGCGRPTGDIAVVTWLVHFPLRTFEIASINQFDATALAVHFPACHSLCANCLAASQRHLNARSRWEILIALAVAAIGPIFLVWSAFEPAWMESLKERLGRLFYILPLALLAAPIVVVSAREERSYRRLPESLRTIIQDGLILSIRPLGCAPAATATPAITGTPPAA